MNAPRGPARNLAKNLLLLTLALLLVVLAAANWISGLNFSQVSADNFLRRAYDRFQGETSGYELRASGVAAADPSQIALSVDGQLYGVQYNLTELDAGLKAMRPLWSQVLSGGVLQPTEEAGLIAALESGGCAMLRYHGSAPLSVVAGWLGGEWDDSTPVKTLIYAEGPERLFVRARDGSLYSASAQVGKEVMDKACEAFRGLPCEFSGSDYAVYPETLLFDNENLSLPLLTASPPTLFEPQSGAGLETLLGAFGYTPYSRTYSEQGGNIRVFVSDMCTLRVSASGLVQYATTGGGGTVQAYDEGEAVGHDALGAQLDCARLILDAALRAGETDTHSALYGVQQDGRHTTLVFLQMYGGVPILGDSDFATFEFNGGTLTTAVIRLQRFRPISAQYAVMPAKQAAAGADGSMKELIAAYREQDGRYAPGRFYMK